VSYTIYEIATSLCEITSFHTAFLLGVWNRCGLFHSPFPLALQEGRFSTDMHSLFCVRKLKSLDCLVKFVWLYQLF